MFDYAAEAIAIGAAGNMVAQLMGGQVDAARQWVARIFRRASVDDQLEVQHALEQDATSLADGTLAQAEADSRWAMRFGAALRAHPDILAELTALSGVGAGAASIHIESHHNEGQAPYVAGNNNGLIFSVVDGKRQ